MIKGLPRTGTSKQIETAVFFDHVAYNRFSAIYTDDEIEEMVLAYINQVSCFYGNIYRNLNLFCFTATESVAFL